jgi:hypothetical protein
VLQLSNFHHHKAGIREQIYVGPESEVVNHFDSAMASVIAEAAIVGLLGTFFLFLYFVPKKGKVCLYFGMLCLSWAMRELFSDLYPISHLIEDLDWYFLVRTEYTLLFLIIIFSTAFVSGVFAELSSPLFKYMIVIISAIFILITLTTPATFFTRWISLYMITASVVLCYAGVLIVRALILEKTGASFLIAGLMLSVLAMGYDLIAYKGILGNHVLISSICYALIYICCAIGVLQYLKIVRSAAVAVNTLTYQDLYK